VTGGGTGRTLARAGLVVTAAYLVSRILGGLRLAIVTAVFPIGDPALDSFLAAFTIPDLIFQLVAAGALSSALIPIIAGLHAHGADARAWRVASTVATLMLAALVVLALVVGIAAPVLVPAIFRGFGPAQSAQTVELTRIMLLSPLLLAVGALATSILNANDRFGAAALAPIVYNIGIIGGALFLAPFIGIEGVAVGVVVGSLAHVLVQLGPLRQIGFRYRPSVDLADTEARAALKLMAPRALGLGASQLTFLVATALLSSFPSGTITAFRLAFTLFQIPFGVIGVPIGVVVLPSLSRELALGAVDRYLSLLVRAMRLVVFVMLPIMVLGIVLRIPVVAVLFRSIDESGVTDTAIALAVLLLALPSESLIALLARAFYADRDTVTPVIAAVLAVAINTTFAIVTVGTLGLVGVSLGIVLGSWSEMTLLAVRLRGRIPGFHPWAVASAGVTSGIAALAAGAVAFVTLQLIDSALGGDPTRLESLVELVVATALGGLTYLGASRVLGNAELPALVGLLVGAVRRPGGAA
jgi:putative peptidoglycan lipid II flippase